MWKILALLPCLAALAACSAKSPFGFSLPDGNPAAGKQAFVDLHCNSCHEVSGVGIEYLEGIAHVPLGGKTTRVRTYGELVTSIINPSHKIAPPHRDEVHRGESLMTYMYLNDVMTVRQLVDVVAFLQPTYQLVQPPAARWAMYQ
jgi:L-cysteine S-thiosulfotransferase